VSRLAWPSRRLPFTKLLLYRFCFPRVFSHCCPSNLDDRYIYPQPGCLLICSFPCFGRFATGYSTAFRLSVQSNVSAICTTVSNFFFFKGSLRVLLRARVLLLSRDDSPPSFSDSIPIIDSHSCGYHFARKNGKSSAHSTLYNSRYFSGQNCIDPAGQLEHRRRQDGRSKKIAHSK
jgi:hypothetical protein